MRHWNLQNFACVNISKRLIRSSQDSIFTNWEVLMLLCTTQQQSGASSMHQTATTQSYIRFCKEISFLAIFCVFGLCLGECFLEVVQWEEFYFLEIFPREFQFFDDILREKWVDLYLNLHIREGKACIVQDCIKFGMKNDTGAQIISANVTRMHVWVG